MISKDKQYKTRNGRQVRIYATDGFGECPIHGAAWDAEMNEWETLSWTENGLLFDDGEESDVDLVPVEDGVSDADWLRDELVKAARRIEALENALLEIAAVSKITAKGGDMQKALMTLLSSHHKIANAVLAEGEER